MLSKIRSTLLCRAENEHHNRTVNIFFGFFLMINFVLGTGFLGIPYGFHSGGVLAGMLTLFCITLISWICAIYVLETMARCQALADYCQNAVNTSSMPRFRILLSRKFEPSEQCQMYAGRWLKIIYLLLLACITFCACIAYCTVAGPAWAVNLPLHFGALEECASDDFASRVIPEGGCAWSYRFCLFLFACIVVPLTLLDLKEQAFVQFLLGMMRFATVGAIILFCFVHLVSGEILLNKDGDPEIVPNYSNSSTSFPEIELYNATETAREVFLKYDFNGWLVSIPVFAYAHILHQGIPALTHPIKEKHWLGGYINLMFLVLGLIYMALGLVVSFWFREFTIETCTLNWDPFKSYPHHIALRVLSYIIILFPSFDVCSAFPLVVHTTVNNIYTVIFGRDTSQDRGLKWGLVQRLMKLIAAVLPIMVAMFVSNLVIVLNYAGIIGFFIAFFFPILLHLRSQWVCRETFYNLMEISDSTQSRKMKKGSPEATPLLEGSSKKPFVNEVLEFLSIDSKAVLYKTPYSTVFSYPIVVLVVGVVSFLTLVFTIASLIV